LYDKGSLIANEKIGRVATPPKFMFSNESQAASLTSVLLNLD
jgi:hypothetical protein